MALHGLGVPAPGGAVGPAAASAGVHEDSAATASGADAQPGSLRFDGEDGKAPAVTDLTLPTNPSSSGVKCRCGRKPSCVVR